MKRKKFVKQLMGMHPPQDRNGAHEMARVCQQHREPYVDGLERYKRLLAWEKLIMRAAEKRYGGGQT